MGSNPVRATFTSILHRMLINLEFGSQFVVHFHFFSKVAMEGVGVGWGGGVGEEEVKNYAWP